MQARPDAQPLMIASTKIYGFNIAPPAIKIVKKFSHNRQKNFFVKLYSMKNIHKTRFPP